MSGILFSKGQALQSLVVAFRSSMRSIASQGLIFVTPSIATRLALGASNALLTLATRSIATLLALRSSMRSIASQGLIFAHV